MLNMRMAIFLFLGFLGYTSSVMSAAKNLKIHCSIVAKNGMKFNGYLKLEGSPKADGFFISERGPLRGTVAIYPEDLKKNYTLARFEETTKKFLLIRLEEYSKDQWSLDLETKSDYSISYKDKNTAIDCSKK